MPAGTLLLLALLARAPAPHPDGGAPDTLAGLKANKLILINADRLVGSGKKNQMRWVGHVKARRDDVLLTCDNMTVFFRGNQTNVTRLLCDGNVEVVEGDRWGHGEHADFDNVTGVLVFTGSPEAREGINHFHGSKVTFVVGTDQMYADNPVADLTRTGPVSGPAGGTASTDGGSSGALAGLKSQKPIHLTSDKLELSGKKNQMVWKSHVKAKRDDVNLSCDRMTVFYRGNQENVTRLLCDGNVEVTERDRWGRGDHADFDNVAAVLVFTGNPEARQGNNHFKGSRVTFHVGTDQMYADNPVATLEDSTEAARSVPKSAGAAGKKPPKPKGKR